MNFRNVLFALFASLILANCSISDVTNLWPTGNSNEEEIVVREIPSESFDPEDTEEIIITESDAEYEDKPAQDMNTVSSVEDIIEDSQDNVIQDNSDNLDNIDVSSIQTYVGDRILEMKDEYQSLDNEVSVRLENFQSLRLSGISSAEVYHSTVAAISARLQIGTTPGNPILLNQYEKAQTELAEVGNQGQMLVDLGNQIALLNTRISYLRDQARSAKRLRGAVDQDHRNLSSLQDNIKRRTVDVVRLLEELNETVRRRDIYLAAERRRLTQLASAIAVGESFGLGLGSLNSLPVSDDNSVEEERSENVSGNPIAVLRIRGESTKYNQGLFGAVSAALERAPKAKFTLVAVSSSAGNASEKAERAANAREKAGLVINSLISMGMPASRLSVTELALAEVEDTEVRVYAD
jgi:hypothetical protein